MLKTKAFLERHYLVNCRLLLGFSGGPDSTALLHLLKECSLFFPIHVDVIHVDHGWRAESGQEAALLQEEVEALGFPFFLKTLSPPTSEQNLEEKGRDERLKILSAMQRKVGYQAVLLAHQADDQAETVLKRVLEGASLAYLGGMEEVSQIEEMEVWRPLLTFRKSEILKWLEKKGLKALSDPTNSDPRFLRARMRTHLFPEVKKFFGKDATIPLGKVGASAHELKRYLERKVEPYLKRVKREKGRLVLDLSSDVPMEKVELKTLLRILAQKEGTRLSFDALETLCKLLNAKDSRKLVRVKRHEFHTHRGVLGIKLKEQ